MVYLRNSRFLGRQYLLQVVLICWIKYSSPQVTIEVRRAQEPGREDTAVLSAYTFPEGFTNPFDWFVTSYVNIPPEGTTTILYQPLPTVPGDPCSEIQPVQFCANSTRYENLTNWALVEGYYTCTQDKIEHVKAAGFDGMVTFSNNNSSPGFRFNSHDQVLGYRTNFDVKSTGFPVVVVSKQFAGFLRTVALTADTNITKCYSVFIDINGDPVRQNWIIFGVSFSMVLILVGLPLFLCLCVCCCFCDLCVNGCPKHCCSRICCTSKGVYQVNQVHIRELGREGMVLRHPHLEEETSLNYTPVERFQRVYEGGIKPATRRYHSSTEIHMSCSICLECFNEEETVHALACNVHHVFHPHCIEQWLETNSVCPVCRAYVIQPSF